MDADLSTPLRSHHDINTKSGAAAARQRAVGYYEKLASGATERGHAIDLVLASLEETEPITRQMLRDAKNSPFAPKEAADV